MLQDPLLCTGYDPRIFLVAEQHTDHRCLGNDTSDFWQNPFHSSGTEKSFRETRAIIIIDRKKLFLQDVTALHRCIHSQISSFGMTADPQHGLYISSMRFQISQRLSVRRNNSVA